MEALDTPIFLYAALLDWEGAGCVAELGLGLVFPDPSELLVVLLLRTAPGSDSYPRTRYGVPRPNSTKILTKAKWDPITGLAVNMSAVPFVVSYQSPNGWALNPLPAYLSTAEMNTSRTVVELAVAAAQISQPRRNMRLFQYVRRNDTHQRGFACSYISKWEMLREL